MLLMNSSSQGHRGCSGFSRNIGERERATIRRASSYKRTKPTEILRNIIDKVIYEDISSFYSLNTGNLDTLKKILYFFGTAQPGSLNINKVATSLKKDHTTIAEYIQILRDKGLLRFLLVNRQGHALVRDAEKIYLENSNLVYAMNN
jgi:predicted AAA+ superfamily ATPase